VKWCKKVCPTSGGYGASGAMSNIYCISMVSVGSVYQRADIQYQLYPRVRASINVCALVYNYMRASMRMRACVDAE